MKNSGENCWRAASNPLESIAAVLEEPCFSFSTFPFSSLNRRPWFEITMRDHERLQ